MRAAVKNGLNPYDALKNNCAQLSSDAASAGGLGVNGSLLPLDLFNQIASMPGVSQIAIPIGGSVPPILNIFNPGGK